MNQKIIIAAVVIELLFPAFASAGNDAVDKPVKEFAYDSFKLVLSHSLDKSLSGNSEAEIADPSGLIILLSEIDSDEARSVLVQLAEIKLGPVHSEALDYAIARQGKKIRSKLNSLLTKSVQCDFLKNSLKGPKYSKLRCFSQHDRDQYIKSLLESIDQGKKIEYVL